jgi:CRP-like cAMP-binding protein
VEHGASGEHDVAGSGSVPTNRLLDTLLRERPGLRVHCETLRVPIGRELYADSRPATHVYFPADAVVSVVVRLSSGSATDVLTVGNEGFVGVAVWLGLARNLETAVLQRPGSLVRIPGVDFCRTVAGSRRIRELLHHYTGYTLRCGSQNAVCNACHSLEQRVCRWLLSAADRRGRRRVDMSQAALADALGVRRQSIGEVAVRLQRDGLIVYRRGDIELLERAALEARACECYRTLREVYRRVLEPRLS